MSGLLTRTPAPARRGRGRWALTILAFLRVEVEAERVAAAALVAETRTIPTSCFGDVDASPGVTTLCSELDRTTSGFSLWRPCSPSSRCNLANLSSIPRKPFKSSAQNFEDVVLWRALEDVEHGCYVDVGAFDPVLDSISWSYYEQGWRGVLIEPVPSLAAALRRHRPSDTTFEVAAGAQKGTARLFVSESMGNSTLVHDVARRVANDGIELSEVAVRIATLDELLEEAGLEGRTIHFCTIDVEGSEGDVLAGFDLARWRPWILVIEATEPNRPRPSHESWENQVLEAGYRFCLFDGVNRFYVHPDRPDEFANQLSYPACVFDDAFNRAVSDARRTKELERIASEASLRTAELERSASEASLREAELERANTALRHRVDQAAAHVTAMTSTVSWRATRPLRAVRAAQLGRSRRKRGLGQPLDNLASTRIPPDAEVVQDLRPYLGLSGNQGPRFSRIKSRRDAAADWPSWADGLFRSGSKVVEGGRRTVGYLKGGTADQPLVTYVTVVRNNTTTLQRAIESVQHQTYANVEHVIIDGDSTDGTLDLITRYADRIDYFASSPDSGLYDALNKAIPLARGDFICVLNSDDWLEPDAAETAVTRLVDVNRPTILLTAAIVRRDQHSSDVSAREFAWYPALVHPGCYFTCADDCHNGIYATRSAYERSGPYDSSYEIAGDFNWIMACLESGVDFVYSEDLTINYVMGGISSDPKKHGQECVRTMRRRFPALTAEEAGGLHHRFFFVPVNGDAVQRPTDQSRFLRRLFIRHSEDDELLRALAWALASGDSRR